MKKNAIGFGAAWLAVLLALGMVDYEDSQGGSSPPHFASPAHISTPVHVSLAPHRARSGPATTGAVQPGATGRGSSRLAAIPVSRPSSSAEASGLVGPDRLVRAARSRPVSDGVSATSFPVSPVGAAPSPPVFPVGSATLPPVSPVASATSPPVPPAATPPRVSPVRPADPPPATPSGPAGPANPQPGPPPEPGSSSGAGSHAKHRHHGSPPRAVGPPRGRIGAHASPTTSLPIRDRDAPNGKESRRRPGLRSPSRRVRSAPRSST
jgi:hypothetical protein